MLFINARSVSLITSNRRRLFQTTTRYYSVCLNSWYGPDKIFCVKWLPFVNKFVEILYLLFQICHFSSFSCVIEAHTPCYKLEVFYINICGFSCTRRKYATMFILFALYRKRKRYCCSSQRRYWHHNTSYANIVTLCD